MLLVKKAISWTFAEMILEHLKMGTTSHNLEELCSDISDIQSQANAGNSELSKAGKSDKEVNLTCMKIRMIFGGKCHKCKTN